VVLISGEPGVRKSRLTKALADCIANEPHIRLRYFCSPHHQDSALYPILTQMERAAGFEREDTQQTKAAKLQALLSPTTPLAEDLALISDLHSLQMHGIATLPDLSPQQKKERTLEALLRQAKYLSLRQPVLMIFEDLHWMDPSSRELVDRMIEQVEHCPVLLVGSFRPEFQPPWAGQSHVTVLGSTDTAPRAW
jgi:predicted ATPase